MPERSQFYRGKGGRTQTTPPASILCSGVLEVGRLSSGSGAHWAAQGKQQLGDSQRGRMGRCLGPKGSAAAVSCQAGGHGEPFCSQSVIIVASGAAGRPGLTGLGRHHPPRAQSVQSRATLLPRDAAGPNRCSTQSFPTPRGISERGCRRSDPPPVRDRNPLKVGTQLLGNVF